MSIISLDAADNIALETHDSGANVGEYGRFEQSNCYVYGTVHTRNPGHYYNGQLRPSTGILRAPSLSRADSAPVLQRRISFADNFGQARRNLLLARQRSDGLASEAMSAGARRAREVESEDETPLREPQRAKTTRTYSAPNGDPLGRQQVLLRGDRMLVRAAVDDRGIVERGRNEDMEYRGCFPFQSFSRKERTSSMHV